MALNPHQRNKIDVNVCASPLLFLDEPLTNLERPVTECRRTTALPPLRETPQQEGPAPKQTEGIAFAIYDFKESSKVTFSRNRNANISTPVTMPSPRPARLAQSTPAVLDLNTLSLRTSLTSLPPVSDLQARAVAATAIFNRKTPGMVKSALV